MTDDASPPSGDTSRESLDSSAVYEAVVGRRISYDQMMWQAPTLSVTAQSFLIAVGVNLDLALGVRVLALVLAAASGAASMQLMAKQRFHEQVDTLYLQRWESQARMHPVGGFSPHDRAFSAGQASKADVLGLTPSRWVRLSSYALWMWALRLFLLATLGLLVWVLLSS